VSTGKADNVGKKYIEKIPKGKFRKDKSKENKIKGKIIKKVKE
jgi:hypothetical protein